MAARARFLDGWNRREEGATAGTAFRFRAEWLSWIANMSDVCFLAEEARTQTWLLSEGNQRTCVQNEVDVAGYQHRKWMHIYRTGRVLMHNGVACLA